MRGSAEAQKDVISVKALQAGLQSSDTNFQENQLMLLAGAFQAELAALALRCGRADEHGGKSGQAYADRDNHHGSGSNSASLVTNSGDSAVMAGPGGGNAAADVPYVKPLSYRRQLCIPRTNIPGNLVEFLESLAPLVPCYVTLLISMRSAEDGEAVAEAAEVVRLYRNTANSVFVLAVGTPQLLNSSVKGRQCDWQLLCRASRTIGITINQNSSSAPLHFPHGTTAAVLANIAGEGGNHNGHPVLSGSFGSGSLLNSAAAGILGYANGSIGGSKRPLVGSAPSGNSPADYNGGEGGGSYQRKAPRPGGAQLEGGVGATYLPGTDLGRSRAGGGSFSGPSARGGSDAASGGSGRGSLGHIGAVVAQRLREQLLHPSQQPGAGLAGGGGAGGQGGGSNRGSRHGLSSRQGLGGQTLEWQPQLQGAPWPQLQRWPSGGDTLLSSQSNVQPSINDISWPRPALVPAPHVGFAELSLQNHWDQSPAGQDAPYGETAYVPMSVAGAGGYFPNDPHIARMPSGGALAGGGQDPMLDVNTDNSAELVARLVQMLDSQPALAASIGLQRTSTAPPLTQPSLLHGSGSLLTSRASGGISTSSEHAARQTLLRESNFTPEAGDGGAGGGFLRAPSMPADYGARQQQQSLEQRLHSQTGSFGERGALSSLAAMESASQQRFALGAGPSLQQQQQQLLQSLQDSLAGHQAGHQAQAQLSPQLLQQLQSALQHAQAVQAAEAREQAASVQRQQQELAQLLRQHQELLEVHGVQQPLQGLQEQQLRVEPTAASTGGGAAGISRPIASRSKPPLSAFTSGSGGLGGARGGGGFGAGTEGKGEVMYCSCRQCMSGGNGPIPFTPDGYDRHISRTNSLPPAFSNLAHSDSHLALLANSLTGLTGLTAAGQPLIGLGTTGLTAAGQTGMSNSAQHESSGQYTTFSSSQHLIHSHGDHALTQSLSGTGLAPSNGSGGGGGSGILQQHQQQQQAQYPESSRQQTAQLQQPLQAHSQQQGGQHGPLHKESGSASAQWLDSMQLRSTSQASPRRQ